MRISARTIAAGTSRSMGSVRSHATHHPPSSREGSVGSAVTRTSEPRSLIGNAMTSSVDDEAAIQSRSNQSRNRTAHDVTPEHMLSSVAPLTGHDVPERDDSDGSER